MMVAEDLHTLQGAMMRISAFVLCVAATSSGWSTTALAEQSVVVTVVGTAPDQCVATIGDRSVDVADIGTLLTDVPRTHSVHIVAALGVDYRCIGGAIYAAQTAGFRRVGFMNSEKY